MDSQSSSNNITLTTQALQSHVAQLNLAGRVLLPVAAGNLAPVRSQSQQSAASDASTVVLSPRSPVSARQIIEQPAQRTFSDQSDVSTVILSSNSSVSVSRANSIAYDQQSETRPPSPPILLPRCRPWRYNTATVLKRQISGMLEPSAIGRRGVDSSRFGR